MSVRGRSGDHAMEHLPAAEALQIEDGLWWVRGRHAILRNYLDRIAAHARPSRILEVGCGSGGNLALLADYGEVTGMERSPVLAERARSRQVAREIVVGDFLDLEPPLGFALTCAFDVLEHVEDDDAFLARLGRSADAGHFLLLSVPACPWLYAPHDVLLHHYRRYTGGGVRRLLARHGWEVLRGSYHLSLLFPLVVASRLGEKLRGRLGRRQEAVDIGVVPAWANRILTGIMRAEARLTRRVSLPIGAWYVALGRKT